MTRKDLIVRLQEFGDDDTEVLIFDTSALQFVGFDELDVDFDDELNLILLRG